LRNTARIAAFVLGSIVSGLAAAFLVILVRPELVGRGIAAGARPAAMTNSAAPAAAAPPGGAVVPAGASAPVAPVPAPQPMERTTFADAVRRSAPAVVNVYTARLVTERVMPSAMEQFFGDFAPRYRQRVERSLGSGVIVDAQGHIVTNHHVIANADAIRVQLADGRVAAAKIVGRDPDTDLAVLQVTLKSLPVMPIGRSDRLQAGDIVLAIGNPLGLSQTVTHGIVSATSRGQLGISTFENFIQTDAPINFGNSGGALVDAHGDLIGINTAIVAKNLGVEGIGFAIPVDLVRGVMSDILTKGRVVRGWAGLVPEDVTDEQAAEFGLAQGGVLITSLYRGSPALEAGLRPGDLIASLDGKPVRSAQDVLARIAGHKPGTTVRLEGVRGNRRFEATLAIVERPRSQ